MSITAMRQALDALYMANTREWPENKIGAAINALSAAIAEAEKQEQCKEHGECFGGKCIYTAPPAAQRQPLNWTVVGEQMPDAGAIVLAYYKNSQGKDRRIRAKWVQAKTLEASGDWDGDCEYDEATDTYYCPQGWYECMDNWDEFRCIFVHEGQVTHWMPLPPAPDTTPPAAQQEPVGTVKELFTIAAWERLDVVGSTKVYLGTLPSAQRQWVGLTEKDFSAINQSCLTKLQAATSAESILKEKNT